MFALMAASSLALAEVVRYAVVVGANDGGMELEALHYAEDDARKMATVLVELGGYEPQNVKLLLQPTPAEVQAAMRGTAVWGEETVFLFYYSGHADARGLRLSDAVYPYEQLKADVRTVDADVHLGVLDACRAGAITRVKGATVVDPFLGESLDASGEAWITAATEDERAQESDRIGGSFFTHYLVSGMRGAAANGDDIVSLNEAYSYAYERTVARTGATDGGTQHPEYQFNLQGKGDLELTVLSQATSRLVLEAGYGGEIMILSEASGELVAEVNKRPEEAMTLALAPGNYKVRRRDGGEVYEVRVGVAEGSTARLGARWGDAATELSQWKGEEIPDPVERAVQVGEKTLAVGEHALTLAQDPDFRTLPAVTITASALMPGAGQLLHEDWWAGAAFLGGSAAFLGSAWALSAAADNDAVLRGTMLTTPAALIGTGIYGWSISHAARYPTGHAAWERPRLGLTVSSEAAWWRSASSPYTAGFGADIMLGHGMSVGLDRTGWTWDAEAGTGIVGVGGRFMVAKEWEKLRPGVFVATGLRIGSAPAGQSAVRPVLSTGANVRYYLGPRYFVGYELRFELDGGVGRVTNGGAVGVHFGG